MKREQLKNLVKNADIIKALLEGKAVQCRMRDSASYPWSTPFSDIETLQLDSDFWEWRIKPEPKSIYGICGADGSIIGARDSLKDAERVARRYTEQSVAKGPYRAVEFVEKV